jgi:hypothetical protein
MPPTQKTPPNAAKLISALIETGKNQQAPDRLNTIVCALFDNEKEQQTLRNWMPSQAETTQLNEANAALGLLRDPNAGIHHAKSTETLKRCFSTEGAVWTLLQKAVDQLLSTIKKTASTTRPRQTENTSKKKPHLEKIKNPYLAVGDETGNWDRNPINVEHPHSFMGVTLVLGRVDDWQNVWQESLNDRSMAQRMGNPVQHLPDVCRKKDFHHALEVWECKHGDMTSAKEELNTNLLWLAQHPRLITLGLYGTNQQMWDKLGGDDPALALGNAYALLAALATPFLNDHKLYIAPGGRTENTNMNANIRAGIPQRDDEKRYFEYQRIMLSSCEKDYEQLMKAHWPTVSPRHTVGFLTACLKEIGTLPQEKAPWDGFSDLGAALLYQCIKGGWKGNDNNNPDQWKNVVFLNVKDI